MPNDIHDRLIARLETMRPPIEGDYTRIKNTLIDMAIWTVRAKCPNCGDRGYTMELSPVLEPTKTIKVECCNRPALLAEWERQLNGGKR